LSEPEKQRYNRLLADAMANAPSAADPDQPHSPQVSDFMTPAEQARFADLTSPESAWRASPADITALNGLKGNYLARKAVAAGLPEAQARAANVRASALLSEFDGGAGPTASRLLDAFEAIGAPAAGVVGPGGDEHAGTLARAISGFQSRPGSGAELDQLAVAMQMEWANAAAAAHGGGGPIKLNRAVYGEQGQSILNAAASGQPWVADTQQLSSWGELLGLENVSAWLQEHPDVAWLQQSIPTTQVFAFWRTEPALMHPDTFALGQYIIIGQEVNSGTATVTNR